MNNVYILRSDLNDWITKHLPSKQDMFSIDDLIGAIEDMDSEIESLKEQLEDKENDYPYEERDREIEVLGIE